MRPSKLPSTEIMRLWATVAAVVVLSAAVFGTGCGDSEPSGPETTADATAKITHPAPGTVEMIDSFGDISADDPNLQTAPTFLDISRASVSREGNSLKFTMELAAVLPEGPQRGTAVEWGFLLDNDQDGTPDWGVYADLSTKDGWLPGIFDQKTKARLTGPEYPGTFTHAGTTLVFTVDAAALGSPAGFKWFAYSDAAMVVASGKTQKAGDRIWEPAVPDNSQDWLPFP